ncbi:MAG: 3-deoxy-manno-octulosonate cytidylyltransferase [Thermodesulfobacteriota bacterium]|nr:3-deoxy-manno-octulosonate cytidylyltransferase [Thermodesulfobacteriota bacterium]
MNIYAFIPARYQSTRFPGKPLARIAGKPMIQHVYERASSCRQLSKVYVATDDERISDCVHEFGGRVVITEKQHRSGTDRICEAAQKAGLAEEDLVVNIQGDQPAFHPSVVTQLIKPLIEDGSINMTTLRYKFTDKSDAQNPNSVKVVTDSQGFALYFSRYPIPFFRDIESKGVAYYKHLGFYGFRMSLLVRFTGLPEGILESAEKLEQLRLLENGFKIKVLESPFDSVEVDVPEDVKNVEEMLR